jgi:hypothetical protein
MGEAAAEREERLRQLASKLFFTLEHKGSRYELYRDADVERPVRHEGLTSTRSNRYSTVGNSGAHTAGEGLTSIAPTLRRWALLDALPNSLASLAPPPNSAVRLTRLPPW